MKQILLFTVLFFAISCKAQENKENEFTYENLGSEILKFEPTKKIGVSENDFKKGVFKLNQTKAAVKNNPKNFTYADYWNITVAFVNLDETNKNIEIAFKKAINLDSTSVCGIIKAFGNSKLDIKIPETFNSFIESCDNHQISMPFDTKKYSERNNLDLALIHKINQVNIDDQKYRNEKSKELQTKQHKLDNENQEIINSLYNKHKTYLGRTLVGEKFETVMWAVIQHSNIEMMEKYLPVIQEAVKNKELDVVPFKMLIDRIYSRKEGYQIFGSQQGVKLANKKTRKEVIEKYKLE
jgi:hypothetical protein